MDLTHHTEVYRAMRDVCPVHIGGSFALILLGYDLGRKPHDIDVIIPDETNEFNYQQLEDALVALNGEANYASGSSTSDFQLGVKTFYGENNAQTLHVDVGFDPNKTAYTDVIFQERSYRVMDINYIIDAKMKYALNRHSHSGTKHRTDLRNLHAQGCKGINIHILNVFEVENKERDTLESLFLRLRDPHTVRSRHRLSNYDW